MEFMSNLGGGAQADRPSLFELIAQDKMREMLEPALRYVTAVCSPFNCFSLRSGTGEGVHEAEVPPLMERRLNL